MSTDSSLLVKELGLGDDALVLAAAHLFDHPPDLNWTAKFLNLHGHHLLIAYREGKPAGLAIGIEMTHPDKGTEMFLYELGVDDRYRRLGIGTVPVRRLAHVARESGCCGMWVLTEDDNIAALKTYGEAGAMLDDTSRMLTWEL